LWSAFQFRISGDVADYHHLAIIFVLLFDRHWYEWFFVPLVSTIARWFNRKRGMMTGIGMSGVGIGTIIIPLIMASFINSYGWRTSYVIVGFITLLSIAGIAQFLRREPSITKSIPQDGELIGTDDLPPENWSSYNVSLRPIERGSKWSKGVTHRSKSLAS
jgi:MFS family permease